MHIRCLGGPARRPALAAALAAALAFGAAVQAPPARAHGRRAVQAVAWQPCGERLDCGTVTVPRDYSQPAGPTFQLALIRTPASEPRRRLGSLFLNPGGPGGSGVALLRGLMPNGTLPAPFAALNRRFDLVGFDPRGVGDSRPSISCLTDDEARAQFARPLPTPDTLAAGELAAWARQWTDRCAARNTGVLPYVGTGYAARDLDRLRQAVGDRRLTYLGFSYGTLLGATYASLFPSRTRALVLDGAVDATTWIRRPLEASRQEGAAFERALSRFFACASRSLACYFTDDDPEVAFDHLVDRLDREPLAGVPGDPRPVTGDTVLLAAEVALYDKTAWALLATYLDLAEQGRGARIQLLADLHWGIDSSGYDHQLDRFLAISAVDQAYPRTLATYLATGADNFALFPHFWWGSGYLDVPWSVFPRTADSAFRGPFHVSPRAPAALVIGTTYDPATPYGWARRLTSELGNARLLTMIGDGHTAFGGNSPCIDDAVVTYVETLELPAPGTECRQRNTLIDGRRRMVARVGDLLLPRRPVTLRRDRSG